MHGRGGDNCLLDRRNLSIRHWQLDLLARAVAALPSVVDGLCMLYVPWCLVRLSNNAHKTPHSLQQPSTCAQTGAALPTPARMCGRFLASVPNQAHAANANNMPSNAYLEMCACRDWRCQH